MQHYLANYILRLQFLNRSIAHSANVIETLAAFGLAYVIVKLFVGVVEEVKQVGVVLVQDRPGFHKILVCVLLMGSFIFALTVLIGRLVGCGHKEVENASIHA